MRHAQGFVKVAVPNGQGGISYLEKPALMIHSETPIDRSPTVEPTEHIKRPATSNRTVLPDGPTIVKRTDYAALKAVDENPNASVRDMLDALGYTGTDYDSEVRGALSELITIILYK